MRKLSSALVAVLWSTWSAAQVQVPDPGPAPAVTSAPSPHPPVDPRLVYPFDEKVLKRMEWLLTHGNRQSKRSVYEAVAPKHIEDRDGNVWEYQPNGQSFIVKRGRNR